MPSYAIHIAVAEEYMKKHPYLKEEHDKFIDGVIIPDMVTDKSLTHYGKDSSCSNLFRFIEANELDDSFKRGYFLHLMTDYMFYNKYIDTWSKKCYNDYDILNDGIIKKYNLHIPKIAEVHTPPTENKELTILSENLVNKFIDDVSVLDINKVVKEVEYKSEKWTTFRPLKII